MQCFDRTYKKIQDVISDIGGIAQAVTFVTAILNYIFNDYATTANVEKIIFPYLSLEEIKKKSDKSKCLSEKSSNNISNINNSSNRGKSVGIKRVNHNNNTNNFFGGGMFGDNDPFNDSFFKFPNQGKSDDSFLAEQMELGFM